MTETEMQKETLQLKPQEIDLIRHIREKYRFGVIEVVCKDGVPIDILRTVERTRLDTKGH